MYHSDKYRTHMLRRCHGFSLVELMVAMVITLILLAGIGQIFLSSKKSFTIQDSLGRMQENGRFVVDTLVQDLRRAGYLGGAVAVEESAGSLPVATGVDTCTGGSWARFMYLPVIGLNETATNYNCITNYLAGSGDVIAVRYAAPWELGSITTPLPATATKVYLHSNPKEPKTARLYTGANLPAKTAGDRQAEVVARAYYIANSGQTCSYQGANLPVPSLYRINLNDSSLPDTAQEIASGIERLQILYGIDNVGADHSVDSYVTADNVTDWSEVIAVRFWILSRAECPETGYTNTTTYVMGADDGSEDFTPPANDHYRRQLFQSTVQLRNRLEGV